MKIFNLKTSPPLISVIIPVYNAAVHLDECLTAVFQQDYPNFEVIVVNDGSTDKSATIIKKYPIQKYIYQENQGPSAARNEGLLVAKGEYISFLDADDTCPFDKLSVQFSYFKKHPQLEIVRGLLNYQFEKSRLSKIQEKTPEYGVHLGTMLLKKTVFEKIGLFDTRFPIGGDMDFWRKILVNKINYLDIAEVCLNYRLHSSNLSLDHGKIKRGYLQLLKNEIDRKRNFEKYNQKLIIND